MNLKWISSATLPLQWVRDQMIAEFTNFYAPGNVGMQMLQWGRDQMIAELTELTAYRSIASSLQWDRDQIIAEISRWDAGTSARSRCFNGSATR